MASAEQTGGRSPALRQPAYPLTVFLLVEVGEYLLTNLRIFNIRNQFH